METVKLMVTLALCTLEINAVPVTIKSDSDSMQNLKTLRLSPKLNSISSSTQNPENIPRKQNQQFFQLQHPQGGLHQIPAPQLNLIATNNVVMPQLHPETQQQILSFIQRALYTSQMNNQPAAMIIIAQPPVVAPTGTVPLFGHHGMFYRNYHPIARPNFSHLLPIQPVIPATPVYQHPSSQHAFQYESIPSTTRMLPYTPQQENVHFRPQQSQMREPIQNLDNLTKIVQKVAENHNGRSLPPIVTGLENFTPEQQVKIKEQLSNHFGSPLLSLPSVEKNQKYEMVNNKSGSTAEGQDYMKM